MPTSVSPICVLCVSHIVWPQFSCCIDTTVKRTLAMDTSEISQPHQTLRDEIKRRMNCADKWTGWLRSELEAVLVGGLSDHVSTDTNSRSARGRSGSKYGVLIAPQMPHYPVTFTPHGCTVLVAFADMPETIAFGLDEDGALMPAVEALETALSFYLYAGLPRPLPGEAKQGQRAVSPHAAV
jgi:hypothetical protein